MAAPNANPAAAPHRPPPAPPAHHSGMARVGKYLLFETLGEGAFGKVRRAVDDHTGREFAIKIMDKGHIKANELTLQVRREIAVMKAMRHPNIVNLHEVLNSSKNLYMVMDLVTGGELFDAVAEKGRLPEARTRLYFQQLVDGVQYCHSRHVFHRDLKPENLLLSGDAQTLKITDFGLSSIKTQHTTSELLHTIMGSPHYIAPEIITSAAAGYEGGKVDVWAAGVILYGMLAGFLPFDGQNNSALYHSIVHSPVQYPPHFSYDVVKLLRAMLQKDPAKRPSMEDIRAYPWFKVDYEPSVLPEQKTPSRTGSASKKPKSKSRRHSERLPRSRRRDARLSSDDNNASQDAGEGVPSANQQQPKNFAIKTDDSKPISQLFRDSSRSGSVDSRATSSKGAVTWSDTVESSCDQENVDPRQPQCKDDGPKAAQANHDLQSKASSLTPPHPPARGRSTSRGEDEAAQQRRTPQPDRNSQSSSMVDPSMGNPPAEDAEAHLGAQDTARLGTTASPSVMSTPPNGRKPQSLSERLTTADDKMVTSELLQSPLTPLVSRFSSATSGSAGSGPEERRQDAIRYHENDLDVKQGSVKEFVSPLSEQSKSSFSTPSGGEGMKPVLSPNYRSLVPLLFSCEGSGDRIGKQSTLPKASEVSSTTEPKAARMPRASDPEVKRAAESADEMEAKQNIEPEPEENQAACEAPDIAEQAAVDEEGTKCLSPNKNSDPPKKECNGIFKPMKSLFAALAEDAAVEQQKLPSTSPSVLCPEFDTEDDGDPQWCLDSMEVFADCEADDSDIRTERKRKSLNFLELMRQGSPREAPSSTEVDATVVPGKPKSIFAPLDDHVLSQLSPSGRNESESSNVIRAAPLVRPEV